MNGNGCESDRAAILVVVNAAPSVMLTNDGPLTAAKTSVLLTASGANSYSFSPGAVQISAGNTATVTTPGLYSVTATGSNSCSAIATTSVATSFDLTAITYVRPSTVYKTDVFTVVVDVLELMSIPISGRVTIKISKDALIDLSFSTATMIIDSHTVQNSQWRFDSIIDENYYVLTTNSVIDAGGQLSFGLTGKMLPGATAGIVAVSTVLISEGGGEYKLSNNTDADKVDYFQ